MCQRGRAAFAHRGNGVQCAVCCSLFAAWALFGTTAVKAADCPGNPDALGTSRTIVVDPSEHPRIGTMQYRETLPLEDHEVVLTFDDGPLPPRSNQVLEILASECVKATYFMVGRWRTVSPTWCAASMRPGIPSAPTARPTR